VTIDLEKRMAEFIAETEPQPLDDWKTGYIVNPGETPWWEVNDRKERQKMCTRQSGRVQYKLHPESYAESKKRYREKDPEAYAKIAVEASRQFNERHPGRALEASGCYYETPKGRANMAKKGAARRKRSTNPLAFAARVLQLHTSKEPCTTCGALYNITHEIDHILALCLGGTDDWDNLQPLCILCHRKKTAEDMKKLVSARAEEEAVWLSS
jgi:5-methylcytosine-specific restriction protein A